MLDLSKDKQTGTRSEQHYEFVGLAPRVDTPSGDHHRFLIGYAFSDAPPTPHPCESGTWIHECPATFLLEMVSGNEIPLIDHSSPRTPPKYADSMELWLDLRQVSGSAGAGTKYMIEAEIALESSDGGGNGTRFQRRVWVMTDILQRVSQHNTRVTGFPLVPLEIFDGDLVETAFSGHVRWRTDTKFCVFRGDDKEREFDGESELAYRVREQSVEREAWGDGRKRKKSLLLSSFVPASQGTAAKLQAASNSRDTSSCGGGGQK